MSKTNENTTEQPYQTETTIINDTKIKIKDKKNEIKNVDKRKQNMIELFHQIQEEIIEIMSIAQGNKGQTTNNSNKTIEPAKQIIQVTYDIDNIAYANISENTSTENLGNI